MTDPKDIRADEDSAGLPTNVIIDAAQKVYPPHGAAEVKLHALFNEIIVDYMKNKQGSVSYSHDIAASVSAPFAIQTGKAEELAQLFDGFASRQSRTGSPDGREAIYKKAILWGQLMQIEGADNSGATPTQIAEATFDKVFAAEDLFKVKRPLASFLKDYWAGDTSTLDAFLDRKFEAIRAELSQPGVMGGIRDDRCKYVDTKDQARPFGGSGSKHQR